METARSKATWSRKLKDNVAGYLFILPTLILFGVFFVFSFYFLIKTSFQDVNLSFLNAEFVGWDNYKLVLSDDRFFKSVFNNFVLSAFGIFVSLTLGFLVSIFLSFKFRGSRLLHGIYFLPSLLPMALTASVFGLMMEYKFGTLNVFLRSIGLEEFALRWLGDPQLALYSVMFVSIYLIGIPMMYYTSELTTLNTGILEAAVIDGAGMWKIIGFILFPLLKNSHKTIILSMLLASFREFERVFLMTDGGPAGATEITSTYIYRYVKMGTDMGYVSAASVIILLIALVISFIQLSVYRRSSRK
ncbi:carbohydrate ABC transporter permease [Marinicrinis lubricantis]|uniref:Carbohydrate ABC transporter permease n=1 Tax=Marinicrinis lubricantis TaxID=2086470 RepID=A0ABW1IPM2_9BACL